MTPSGSGSLRWRVRTASPAVRAVCLALLAILVASAARNIKEEGDFRGYLEVGELVLQGRDIYAEARPDVNTWPPFYALVCVPFALLARPSVYLARGVWLLLNAGLLYAVVRIGVALVYRRPVTLGDRPGGISVASLAVLGPLLLTSRFFLGTLDRLQINLLILTCCLAGCLWLVRGKAAWGGGIIGLGAAIKVLPVFFLPYFLWKRWWRALAAAAVVGGACTVSPALVFGPQRWWSYLLRWLEIASGGWPVRKGNQSVYAMVDRLYTHGAVFWSPAHTRLAASNDPIVSGIVYGLLAVVALLLIRAARQGGDDPASPAVTTELAIILAVTVLFSPLAWKHYFVFLWLGHLVLWRAAVGSGAAIPDRPGGAAAAGRAAGVAAEVREVDADEEAWRLPEHARRRLRWVLVLSFALTTLTVRGIVGKAASRTFETMSTTTLGALVVLAGLLAVRALLGAREAELSARCGSRPHGS